MEPYPLKWITDDIAVGYAPRSEDQLQSLYSQGIRTIVNLCAECYDLHHAEKEANFEVLYLPIVDEGTPTLEQMKETLSWMTNQVVQGNKILVHCRYGIGRTGTVVLIYLLHCGVSFGKAKKMMEHTPSWPSTNAQKHFVDMFLEDQEKPPAGTLSKEKNSTSVWRFFRRLEDVMKWDD